ncbi:endoplasmic oxidoreductin [Cylindrobasidium torrendii FP15055 ss-10]|uniref:Endoplasmic oxidoreductin n=1 Tax=Cylindrobasidium torrendii FP15055 ss-10 TaxID=1314674 RepID=A0A0D7BW05_9AGAR|nr:endoplasmic oxidoreductin [Cylindrobasidium torrendii FP15055 ss-10]
MRSGGLCRFALIAPTFLSFASASLLFDENAPLNSKVKNVLQYEPVKEPLCDNQVPTGPIDTTTCDFETVDSVNEELYSTLHDLVATPFFKYFRADLYRECPFWDDNGSCSNPGCAITSIDESNVPEPFRATALSKLGDPEHHSLPGCYYRDSDFCFLDDNSEGEYYDLSLIPERYTGYSGEDAQRVWRTIYQENCFGLSEANLISGKPAQSAIIPNTISNDDTDQCLEKRVYYKIVSGLHASISTHICSEWLNQATGEWEPNLQCFVNKVAAYPERLKYVYFNTVLLLRAMSRLGPYLSAYDYCSTGTHEDDLTTRTMLDKVIDISQHAGKFDESVLFRGDNANVLKEEFKTHFRNVTRIMDCIGCDKCRLWGKVQTTGIATALKILFELDEKALDPHTNANLLQRAEVVALVNTLHRFSESLNAVNTFRQMWGDAEKERVIADAEKSTETATSYRPASSLRIGTETRLIEACERVLRVCKDTTWGCVEALSKIWSELISKVSSAFTSDKAHGPGSSEL